MRFIPEPRVLRRFYYSDRGIVLHENEVGVMPQPFKEIFALDKSYVQVQQNDGQAVLHEHFSGSSK